MKNGKEFYYPKGRRGFKGGPVVPPNIGGTKRSRYYVTRKTKTTTPYR